MLLNLVLNAQAASADGVVTVRTGHPGLHHGVDIVSTSAPAHVGVWVEDSGSGMSSEVLARAFEPFFTTNTAGESAGIGLSVVRQACEQAGIGVSVDTIVGRGTSVLLRLATEAATAPAVVAGTSTKPGSRRALVVDDERAVRQMIVRVLEGGGYVCVEADDGAAGLAAAAAGSFDLLVTDLLMPNLNGAQLIDELRARGWTAPIVLVSGFAGTLDLPADVVRLEKPFSVAALRRAAGVVLT